MRIACTVLFGLLAFVVLSRLAPAEEHHSPKIIRIYPLGGQQGTSVTVEILGEFLSNAESVEFDSKDLVWTKILSTSSGKVSGTVSIASDAALGSHLFRISTLDGPSTSALF